MSGGASLGVNFVRMFSFISEYTLLVLRWLKQLLGLYVRLQSLLKRDFRWCWVYSRRKLLSRRVSLIFLLHLFRAYFIAIAIAIPPKLIATPSRTNPTGAATTLARRAISVVPAAIPPHSAIVSTIDKVWMILLYFFIWSLYGNFFLDIVDFVVIWTHRRLQRWNSNGLGRQCRIYLYGTRINHYFITNKDFYCIKSRK